MKLTEEQLRRAAKLAQQKDLARLPEADTILVSPRMEQKMQTLITQVKRGEITPARASMGWRYYTRNGIAAVLIGFLLTCAAMPEVVIAGCQRLIQMVETVFEEYTQQEYTSNASAESTFVPVSFGYMPEGMVEVEREQAEDSLRIKLENSETAQIFVLRQELLTEEGTSTYIIDTEDAITETVVVLGESVEFIQKEEQLQFVWVHAAYRITGKTNLPQKETIRILKYTKFDIV
ncbi:MAG: DUF4367 domain-containing protein [Peptococcaceae bacterium]|nr:DUF4367 domain-containing protein [Peptococcaceae bacterium]MBR2626976.1 DUF4367 domain-containing protein [Peptococcaceae bacterium]